MGQHAVNDEVAWCHGSHATADTSGDAKPHEDCQHRTNKPQHRPIAATVRRCPLCPAKALQ